MMEQMYAGTTLLGNVHRWNITRVELCANHVTIKNCVQLCAMVYKGVQMCSISQQADKHTDPPIFAPLELLHHS